ncbi:MAG: hypothetical protein JWQ71_347 [Pedosphaera sp.]|nr:hypothetical protein [Pedosphaera sp.]
MKIRKKQFFGGLTLIIGLLLLWMTATVGAAGLVAAWGFDYDGTTITPVGLGPVKAITAGATFSAALKGDGTVAVWGNPYYTATLSTAGLSNIKAISAGSVHIVALRADGSVVAWGQNDAGQTNVPAGLSGVIAVTAGSYHSLALKYDGAVVAWGANDHGQTNVPSTLSNVVAVAGGFLHDLALKVDGTVVVWGDNTYGQTNVPVGLSNVVAVAAGDYHSLALRSDGTVWAWGGPSQQTNVPAGLSNVVAIAAGYDRSMALKSDGTIIMWGGNAAGQSNVPVGLVATAIAVGGSHNLALVSEGPVQMLQNPQSQIVTYSSNATLSVNVTGYQPISFKWRFNGSNLVDNAHVNGSTNSTLTINNLLFSDTGNYSVVVSNAMGSMVSSSAVLTVISPPLILQQSPNQTVRAGSNVTFSVSAIGSPVLSYQWQFGGTNLAGATSSSLALINVQPAMSGDYVLTISNTHGMIQSTISLVVTDSAPYILLQPAGKNVALGGTATFSVTVRGSLPLSYQWRFNGADISGATNSTLNFSNLNYDQTGFYNVVATNPFGEVISTKAFLSVLETLVLGSDSIRFPTNVPPGLTNLVAISAGSYHILALKSDGSIVQWISSTALSQGTGSVNTLTNIPSGLTNVTAISAGSNSSMVLKSDGRVVVWGNNANGQTNVPAGLTNVSGIAAGLTHCLVLRSNGTVAAWGDNRAGQTNIPPGLTNIVAVAAGTYCCMALRADGTVAVWGGFSGESRVPAGLSNVVAIDGAKGNGNCMALKADGTVVEWGELNIGTPPSGLSNVVAIAEGKLLWIALKKDGTVVTWGNPKLSFPEGLKNVFAITGGGAEIGFYAVLVGSGKPTMTLQPFSQTVNRGTNVQFTAFAVGRQPMNYQWQHDGVEILGATNSSLTLTNTQGKDTGGYRLIVSNALGMTNSTTAFLNIPFTNTLAGALNATNFQWTTSASLTNALWFPQIRFTHDGDSAAQSGGITNGQQSTLQTVVTGPGTMTFWWKVSSEEGFDFLNLTMDKGETTSMSISGEVDWEQRSFTIPVGSHSLIWKYSKDASVSDGLDAGWLDQVVFIPDPVTIVQQPVSQTVMMGTTVTFNVQATGTVALTYQWLKNGINLLGATKTSLTLSSVTQDSAGVYAVRVSNGALNVLSSNAVLNVVTPQVLAKPSVQSDGSYTLTSRSADGSVMGADNLSGFELQASSDLLAWTTLTNTPVLTNGTLRFIEPGSTNYTRRFYRVIQKP